MMLEAHGAPFIPHQHLFKGYLVDETWQDQTDQVEGKYNPTKMKDVRSTCHLKLDINFVIQCLFCRQLVCVCFSAQGPPGSTGTQGPEGQPGAPVRKCNKFSNNAFVTICSLCLPV